MSALPDVPESIDCIDCGGVCHRISYAPEDGFTVGDIVAYRCRDCLDRWDLEVGAAEEPYEDDIEERFRR